MTTYSAVTAGEKDADSPINVGLIAKLDDNPHAIVEGNSTVKIADGAFNTRTLNGNKLQLNTLTTSELGTDSVDSDELASNAVKQGHLSISTNETTKFGSGTVYITPTGGQYTTGWEYKRFGSTTQTTITLDMEKVIASGQQDTYYRTLKVVTSGSSADHGIRESYVTASPPFKIGGIDFPFFANLKLDESNKIILASLGDTPPWAYNGPYNCAATHYEKRLTELTQDQLDAISDLKYKISTIERSNDIAQLTEKISAKRAEVRKIKNRSKNGNPSESDIEEIKEKLHNIDILLEERAKKEQNLSEIMELKKKISDLQNSRKYYSVPCVDEIIIPPEILALKKTDYLAYSSEKSKLQAQRKPLTYDLKNRNMPYCPHPFPFLAKGEKVVLLAPDDYLMRMLLELQHDPDVSFRDLWGSYLSLGPETTISGSPPGVSIVRAKIK